MTTLHLNLSDSKQVKQVAKNAFPNYNGRKFKVQFGTKNMSIRSYWDGGSRTYYALVNLATMEAKHAPTSHPFFNKVDVEVDNVEIPQGFVIVAHSIFCGKDMGLTVYTPEEKPQLASGEGAELTDRHILVLVCTASRKSSYAGVRDYRKSELMGKGFSSKEVDELREDLIEGGYLTRRKAISNKGRNAIDGHPLRWSF